MRRREFVWMVAGVTIAPVELLGQRQTQTSLPPPPAPVPWTLGLNAKTPIPKTLEEDAIAKTDLTFFSHVQFATLVRLSALLLPTLGAMPGAVEAETPAFLDFLIGGSPASRRNLYTGGLDWLEAASRQACHMAFAHTSDVQGDNLVRPWLRTWMTDHPPTEVHADFINIAHADIRLATMNSRAWNEALLRSSDDGTSDGLQMYWSPIDPEVSTHGFHGGIHGRPSPAIPAPPSEHTTQSYPR